MPPSKRPAFPRSSSLAATAAEKATRGTCGRKDILGTWWSLSSSRKMRRAFLAGTHSRNFCRYYMAGFRSSVGVTKTGTSLGPDYVYGSKARVGSSLLTNHPLGIQHVLRKTLLWKHAKGSLCA